MEPRKLIALIISSLLVAGVVCFILVNDNDSDSSKIAKTKLKETPQKPDVKDLPVQKLPVNVPRSSLVVRVVAPVDVHVSPDEDSKAVLTVEPLTEWAILDNRLLVTETKEVEDEMWYRVLLPIKPNGTTGWVQSDVVQPQRVKEYIQVDISKKELTLYRLGKKVRSFPVVVGKPSTPTPKGTFAIMDMINTPASGFTGSRVLVLTAHSNALDSFEGDPARTAIHGRGGASLNTPVGQAASNGCVRVRNRDVEWLAKQVDVGTPVGVIR